MDFARVSRENGLWKDLLVSWEAQCGSFNENFDEYASASMTVLKDLADGVQLHDRGVYALFDKGAFHSVAQLNCNFLPGYEGKVLRVRHIVLAPEYDFSEDIPLDVYGRTLALTFDGVLNVATSDMPATHVKFHLRSRGDRQFFSEVQPRLAQRGEFAAVEMRGAWLYLSTRA